MQASHYAQALLGLLESGHDPAKVLARLDEVLARKGHAKLRPAILQQVSTRLARRGAASRIFVAAEGDAKEYAKEVQTLLKERGIDEAPDVHIDTTLIGGFKLETTDVRIDKTYKRALIDLYRRIIA